MGTRVKHLRSHNGREYCLKVFDDYLKTKGTTHQTTVPYCPKQNGIVERMDRTLVEAARSMMFHVGMPRNLTRSDSYRSTYLVQSEAS